MKTSAGTLAAILGLSLGVWVLFYFLPLGEPLTPPETLVVVGFSAAAVLAVKGVWAGLRKRRGAHAEKT